MLELIALNIKVKETTFGHLQNFLYWISIHIDITLHFFQGIRIPVLRGVIKMRKGKWMRLIYILIQNSDWVSAENIYYGLKGWGETFRDSFDLKAVCNINLLHEHSWAVDYIMDLMKNGSDWRKLCIEKGESYLHAGVRIALATGNLKCKV